MKDEQATKSNLNGSKTKRKRLPYSSPNLQIYGAVRQLTSGSSGMFADNMNVATNPTKAMSDRRTKENIVQVGTHWSGIGLYLFNYKPEYKKEYGRGRQFGVMADEVEAVMPAAISQHPSGYKMVNYAMLGINQAVQ